MPLTYTDAIIYGHMWSLKSTPNFTPLNIYSNHVYAPYCFSFTYPNMSITPIAHSLSIVIGIAQIQIMLPLSLTRNSYTHTYAHNNWHPKCKGSRDSCTSLTWEDSL